MSRSNDRPAVLVLPPVLAGGLLLAGVLGHYWIWTVTVMGVYIAVSLWVDGLFPLLLLPVVFAGLHLAVVRPEEAYLQSKFGNQYEEYRARVRRWI